MFDCSPDLPARPTRSDDAHRRRRRLVALTGVAVAAILVIATPFALAAQRVIGGGEDAITLPRGGFRFSLGGEHTAQRDRWRDGTLEGLGGSISSDAFGPLQFSMLAPVEQIVRDLGVSDFNASLGVSRLDARQRFFVTPLAVEYGLSDRITLGARASLVRSKIEAQFRIRGDSGRATLGVNPYFTGSAVAANNGAAIGSYVSASTNLGARLAACQGNPGAALECPTILAEAAAVNALVSGTSAFASGLRSLYGGGLIVGRRYVPMAGSTADSLLRARADSMRAAFVRYGVNDITALTGLPLGAQTPVSAADVDRIFADSIEGYGAQRVSDGSILELGDVHLSAKVRLFDSFDAARATRFAPGLRGVRQSVLVDLRLGTGTRERPDAFLDLGTGTGTTAVIVRSLTDVVVNDRFWTSIGLGYTLAAAKDLTLRVPSTEGTEWLESWRETVVPVTPGGQIDVSIAPRWHLNDYVALGASWHWRGKSADKHDIDSTATTPFGGTVPLLGSILDDASKASEQRFGWSATYSTLAARARGRTGMAFELSYVHEQSYSNGTGVVPKQWQDRLQVRYYTRFLGR